MCLTYDITHNDNHLSDGNLYFLKICRFKLQQYHTLNVKK